MMSWTGLYVNPKYDPYRVIRLRSLLELDNIFQVRKDFTKTLNDSGGKMF